MAGPTKQAPRGPRPRRLSPGRISLYAVLIFAAVLFLAPGWVMVVTSLKTMDEIRLGNIFAWPSEPTFEPWIVAWSSACTGLQCGGISVGFVNSIMILVPSLVISIFVGAVNGYAIALWRPRGANVLFTIVILAAFIPYQIFLYPLVRIFASIGIYNTLACIVFVHTLFGLQIMTLLFRNYYAGMPIDLFKAARVDGCGFWSTFFRVFLPASTPALVVAAILQLTGIWNDFILGLVFAGPENLPMTVQLNNIVNVTTGERNYNVNMAATLLTAAIPLAVYFISGRWFVRGIVAGAVKG